MADRCTAFSRLPIGSQSRSSLSSVFSALVANFFWRSRFPFEFLRSLPENSLGTLTVPHQDRASFGMATVVRVFGVATEMHDNSTK